MKLRWWLEDKWHGLFASPDAKLVGAIAVVALLALGGYLAAHEVTKAHGGVQAKEPRLVRLVRTVRYPVKVRVHGHTVTRWRVRREVVTARPQTVMQTQTIHTAGGTRVVTRPVVTYRATKKKAVTVTNARTSTVVDSRTQTVVQTVTHPVTVERTVVTTVTEPGTTVTVTLPGTTVTVPTTP